MTNRNHHSTLKANTPVRPTMGIIFTWLLFIGCCLLSACSNDQAPAVDEQRQEAKEKLEQQGIAFTEAEFLQRVCLNDHYVVGLFLRAGMSPDTKTGDHSALSHAILAGNDLMVRLLINHDANPNQVLSNKKCAYMLLAVAVAVAVAKLDADNVEYLLEHGGDVNINYDGKPLVAAALLGAKFALEFSRGEKTMDYVRVTAMVKSELKPQPFK